MAFKYKGCFTSKPNNNFDQVETMRFTSSQYYRSLLDCRSFLHNNRIDKFKHRVFYFMHRDQLTDQTLRMMLSLKKVSKLFCVKSSKIKRSKKS